MPSNSNEFELLAFQLWLNNQPIESALEEKIVEKVHALVQEVVVEVIRSYEKLLPSNDDVDNYDRVDLLDVLQDFQDNNYEQRKALNQANKENK